MTRSARRRFTDDFKQEAVRLTLTSGRTIKQVRTAEQYSPTEATGFSGFAGPIWDRL